MLNFLKYIDMFKANIKLFHESYNMYKYNTYDNNNTMNKA